MVRIKKSTTMKNKESVTLSCSVSDSWCPLINRKINKNDHAYLKKPQCSVGQYYTIAPPKMWENKELN